MRPSATRVPRPAPAPGAVVRPRAGVPPVARDLLLLACLLLLAAEAAAGEVRVRDDPGLRAALAAARPGTTILLEPGTYRGGLHRADLAGTAEAPVVIAGADRDRPPVIAGGATGLHVAGAAHLMLRDLVLEGATGNGVNVDDAGVIGRPSHHVVLRRLVVRDVGPRGNRDGIKLSGVEDLLVEDCRIERWGDGGSAIDMVGCHRGEILGCTLRHDAPPGGSGVQAKGGSRAIAIRRCRFERTGGRAVNLGGSTGAPFFRPPAPGYEAKDLLVEDCTFLDCAAPIAFVGVDGAVVRHNTFQRPRGWVVRILQESRGEGFAPCRSGRFERNLVVFRAADLRAVVNVGPDTEPGSFRFARNAWSCEDRPEASRPALPVPEEGGVYGAAPGFVDAAHGDLRLAPGSPAQGYGARAP